jgi:hypothetical protein
MNKYILILIGMMNFSVLGMDQPQDCFQLIPDQMPKVFEYIRYSDEDVERNHKALACCNKRLSSGVVFNEYSKYEFLPRLEQGAMAQMPLRFIVSWRSFAGLSDTKRYFWVARHYLNNGQHSLNDEILFDDVKKTLLHEAICKHDRKYVQLLLEHNADPYKIVLFAKIGGPNCYFNAFHWQQLGLGFSFDDLEHKKYSKGNEPDGWLKDMVEEIEKKKQQK